VVADAPDRLTHIKDAIENIRHLLANRTREDIESDVVTRAALERFVEIISEASRHIPTEWKEEHGPNVPWRDIANVGNVLRHVYQNVEVEILWSVYADDLDPLESAIDAMVAANRE
jgi:uncharacterized protein with HEPN domain